ncbi:MAG: polymorphic toxin-type HINT domain-containing protein [Pirellulaceae bacterium]
MPAGDLKTGDNLVSYVARRIAIASVCSTEAVSAVYNLRVADHHTYFVGGSVWGWDVWGHNTYRNGAIPTKYGLQVTSPSPELMEQGALRKLAVQVHDMQNRCSRAPKYDNLLSGADDARREYSGLGCRFQSRAECRST